MGEHSTNPIQLDITIYGKPLKMELDIGTDIWVRAENYHSKYPTSIPLKMYTGTLAGEQLSVKVEISSMPQADTDVEFTLGSVSRIRSKVDGGRGSQILIFQGKTSIKPAVEQELECFEEQGVLNKVNCSEWATLVVAILKKDGICGDYNVSAWSEPVSIFQA